MKFQNFVTNLDLNKLITILVVIFIVVYLISSLVNHYDFSEFSNVVNDLNETIKNDEIISFIESKPDYYYQIDGESYCISKEELKGKVNDDYLNQISTIYVNATYIDGKFDIDFEDECLD